MKIAYLSTHYPSLSHTFVLGEISALESRGHHVVPIALNPPDEVDLRTDAAKSESARTKYIKTGRWVRIALALLGPIGRHPVATLGGWWRAMYAARYDLQLAWKRGMQFWEGVLVWRHCQTNGVTSIHAHFGQAPATVASFAAAYGNAVARGSARWTWSLTVHGWHEFANEDTADLRSKFASADQVVCISDFTRAQVLRLTAADRWDRIGLVRCGIDLELFGERPSREVSDVPVVVTTGRLSPEKGHSILVAAVALLRSEGFPVRVRLIGHGPFRDELVRSVERHGVADLVEFVGPMSPNEVAEELRAADVFCLPTFAEGLPVAIMEAMAVGVPVVTTYIAGIPELVVNRMTGWIVPAGNERQLADAILSASRDPRRDEVIAAARRAVSAEHDRNRNVLDLERLLIACHEEPG